MVFTPALCIAFIPCTFLLNLSWSDVGRCWEGGSVLNEISIPPLPSLPTQPLFLLCQEDVLNFVVGLICYQIM